MRSECARWIGVTVRKEATRYGQAVLRFRPAGPSDEERSRLPSPSCLRSLCVLTVSIPPPLTTPSVHARAPLSNAYLPLFCYLRSRGVYHPEVGRQVFSRSNGRFSKRYLARNVTPPISAPRKPYEPVLLGTKIKPGGVTNRGDACCSVGALIVDETRRDAAEQACAESFSIGFLVIINGIKKRGKNLPSLRRVWRASREKRLLLSITAFPSRSLSFLAPDHRRCCQATSFLRSFSCPSFPIDESATLPSPRFIIRCRFFPVLARCLSYYSRYTPFRTASACRCTSFSRCSLSSSLPAPFAVHLAHSLY